MQRPDKCITDAQSAFQDWIDSTAEFMKSLDPNHLVTVGCEGFLGSSTPGVLLVIHTAVMYSVMISNVFSHCHQTCAPGKPCVIWTVVMQSVTPQYDCRS